MQIALLTHFPGPGGSTAFVRQLTQFFTGCGHRVHVLTSQDHPEPQIEDYQVVSFSGQGGWRQRLKEYHAAVAALRPDVVYAVSGVEEADLLRFIPFPRCQHVFTLEQHELLDVPHWVSQLGRYWEACTGNTPDLVEALTKLAPGDYAGMHAPYLLDPVFFSLRPEVRDDPARPLEICNIGRLDAYQKRAHWLPDIIQRCAASGRNFLWHIYGSGPVAGQIEAELKARQCGHLAVFHGWCSSQDLAKKAPRHDVYFSCSRFDGLPVAMLEAMFCGLACVVPHLPGGIGYIVENGGAWGYDAVSPAASAQALMQSASDYAVVARQKAQAHRTAHRLFGPRAVEDRLCELERKLRTLRHNGHTESFESARRVRTVPLATLIRRKSIGFKNAFVRAVGKA